MGSASIFYIAQAAYGLTLLSYSVRNIAWLRALAIAAGCVAIFYGFSASREPLWIPILWNFLFIVVNGVHLALSRWRARDVALGPLEDFLAKTVLMNFPQAEVRSFTALAGEGELGAGSQLIHFNTEISHLFCLLKGKVHIMVKERKVAELGPGRFVGEMSLLTRSRTRADVVVAEDIKVLVWKHEDIEKWVNSDASRLGLLQSALGTQIVEELLRQQTQQPDLKVAE
jgi:hypothetical protein